MPRPSRGSRCQLAALPLQLQGLWKSASSHPAPAAGTKGHCCWYGCVRSLLSSPSAKATGSGRLKFSQRGPFVLTYGCGDEWKFMGLFILIKSRGHLRRNRLSEEGTSKGKCVVRKFMDFSICKAEVCSLFMLVLLLTLFMGHFKNP